jgi:hypothetical protein
MPMVAILILSFGLTFERFLIIEKGFAKVGIELRAVSAPTFLIKFLRLFFLTLTPVFPKSSQLEN